MIIALFVVAALAIDPSVLSACEREMRINPRMHSFCIMN